MSIAPASTFLRNPPFAKASADKGVVEQLAAESALARFGS
jgi:hypothetical protein